MSITVHLYYTGKNGSARKFAEEMTVRGIVDAVRAEEGNEQYAYFFPMEDPETVLLIDRWKDQAALDFHHKSPMMAQIAQLREACGLHLRVERYTDLPASKQPVRNCKEWQALEEIRQKMETIPGHLGFYYQNLVTGTSFGVHEEECFAAASVIKLPLYLHILRECAAGRMSAQEKLLVTDEDKVPICGALTLFNGDVETDVQTLCRLMISLSDNTATNRLIRHATLEGAASGLRAMGLEKTQLTRLLFDSQASRAGLQNVICPREIGMLLEKLYRDQFVSPQVCREALDVLLLQQVDHKLNGKICGAVPIAHKTGEDDGISNDVGIVYAKQPFVICFAGQDTDVYAWEDLMRQGTYALYQALEG